jgi:hypothetical protein
MVNCLILIQLNFGTLPSIEIQRALSIYLKEIIFI